MEIYKRKVNISDFFPDSYGRQKMWLIKFIIESKIYTVVNREGTLRLVSARKYDQAYNDAETFSEVLDIMIGWLCSAHGIYATEQEALADIEECVDGMVVFVNGDSNAFFEQYETINDACSVLNSDSGETVQYIDIPVYISEDIKDIGTYDVYEEDKAKEEGLNWDEESKIIEENWSSITDYSAFTESKLATLTRQKREYDSEGNILPYVVVEGGKELPYTIELPYKIGVPCNARYADETVFCDILTAISYYDADTLEEITEARGKNAYDGTMPENGIIEFKYYVGAKVDTSGTSGGVMYLERREYHVEDGEYIVVGNETIDKPDDYEDGVQYAIITIKDVGLEQYDDGHLIANEAFIGVNDSRQSLQEVYVDRGTSASYEAFNVLGESNTIEDIENYRDDWFRIKGKND